MPEFDLENWTPERTYQTLVEVEAIMTYPHQPALRASIQAHRLKLPHAFFPQLFQEIQYRKTYSEYCGYAMLQGHTAGQLLILIKQLEDAGYEGSIT
jgi:hypothetical protein